MALVRVTPLNDFRTAAAALTTSGQSTGYDLSTVFTAGQRIYAALHLTCASLGTTARMLTMAIQSASSSGFATLTTEISFTRSTAIGAEWSPTAGNVAASVGSTDRKWWRAVWGLSTAASTGGQWQGLVYVGFK